MGLRHFINDLHFPEPRLQASDQLHVLRILHCHIMLLLCDVFAKLYRNRDLESG